MYINRVCKNEYMRNIFKQTYLLHQEKGRRTKNMLNLDPWNLVMIVINLLVLYAIFRKFLYKPVMNVIHQREELIQGQFDSAKKTQDDALQLKADYEEKLQKANVKADEIILAARDQAKEEHEKAVLETQAKTDRMIEKAKADIEKEQKQAQQEVQGEIAKLALIAARKIIETGEAHDAEGSK